jgi:hypothetical protein
VHHGDALPVAEQRLQRIADLERERIDQRMTAVPAQLQQRQLRIERIAAHELGIEADRCVGRHGGQPRLQRIAVIDPVGAGGVGQ